MSRSGSKRSIAPINPIRPYETRSFSSTCAGSPLPSRPATYLTSGAYVRIRRSRTPWSFVFVYSRQRAWVSSWATVREYDLERRFPQIPDCQAEQPECDRARADDHDDETLVRVDGLGSRGCDPHEGDRKQQQERTEYGPRRSRSHDRILDKP